MSLRLYIWQRLTAALMAPLVLVHVAVIFYARRKGLSAADILARTRGSLMWASFYGAALPPTAFASCGQAVANTYGRLGLGEVIMNMKAREAPIMDPIRRKVLASGAAATARSVYAAFPVTAPTWGNDGSTQPHAISPVL